MSFAIVAASTAAAAGILFFARWKRGLVAHAATEEPVWEHLTCRMPAKLAAREREKVKAEISMADRSGFYALSCCPITDAAEQRMEQISTVVCKENCTPLLSSPLHSSPLLCGRPVFTKTLAHLCLADNDHWEKGEYRCARCGHVLYDSGGKFVGPCLWPSFRRPHALTSLHTIRVTPGAYNKYTCEVHELYCGGCQLFLGHQFLDGVACGDKHPEAGWRHCVLSLSMLFSHSGET